METEGDIPNVEALADQIRDLEKRVAALEMEIRNDHETLEHDHELLEKLDSELHSKGEGPTPVGL